MNLEEHRDRLVTYLDSVAKPGCSVRELNDDEANLVQAAYLDSFAIIQIIFYLEENYGMDLQALGIDPADLISVAGMMTAIERHADLQK